jgi:nucleoside-diphosphate-sugar epimerase
VYSLSNTVPYTESEVAVPLSLYGVSKAMCEQIVTVYARRFPVHVASLRTSRVLGYGDRTGDGFMLMDFVRRARKKQPLHVWGQGVGARDTIYVKDVVGAIEKAVDPDAASGVFNIGGGRASTYREIAEAVNRVFDNVGNVVFDVSKEEDTSSFYMDCSRAESHLKWRRMWSLEAGLREMKELYEQEEN